MGHSFVYFFSLWYAFPNFCPQISRALAYGEPISTKLARPLRNGNGSGLIGNSWQNSYFMTSNPGQRNSIWTLLQDSIEWQSDDVTTIICSVFPERPIWESSIPNKWLFSAPNSWDMSFWTSNCSILNPLIVAQSSNKAGKVEEANISYILWKATVIKIICSCKNYETAVTTVCDRDAYQLGKLNWMGYCLWYWSQPRIPQIFPTTGKQFKGILNILIC